MSTTSSLGVVQCFQFMLITAMVASPAVIHSLRKKRFQITLGKVFLVTLLCAAGISLAVACANRLSAEITSSVATTSPGGSIVSMQPTRGDLIVRIFAETIPTGIVATFMVYLVYFSILELRR